jgi:hypothetical protein
MKLKDLQITEMNRLEIEIAAEAEANRLKPTQNATNALNAKRARLEAIKTEHEYIGRLEAADKKLCASLTPEKHRELLDNGRRERLIERDMDSRRDGLTGAAREAQKQRLSW